MKKALFFPLQVSLCTVGCLQVSSSIAQAQVTPDGTVNTVVTPNENVSEITGGETRGTNLFHSFQSFSIPTGNEAFFNNADSISNIFSRVTGGNISNIDGAIRANGSANLFLINPAGIIFGENARLDIGGSFLGSTNSSVLFEGGEFSAVDLENPPLLTVNAPIGLGFRDNPGDIVNRSVDENPNETNATGGAVGLQVANGKTLALVGGNVLLDDGNLTVKGGNLRLGAVRQGNVTVDLSNPTTIVLDYAGVDLFGDISLENTAVIDVSATGGGNINLNGANITVDSSNINAGIFPGLGNEAAQGGNVFINATDSLSILQEARISNSVGDSDTTGTIGNSGNLVIETRNLTVADGSQVSVSTFGEGDAGDLTIFASESIDLRGQADFPGGLFAQVDILGRGNGGNLNIETQQLSVSDGSKIQVSTFGLGNAGNLSIKASDVEVFETSQEIFFSTGIFAETSIGRIEDDPNVQGVGTGQAGNLLIETERLSIRTGGQVSASTFGDGDAGSLTIRASDRVEVIGKDLNSNSSSVIRSDVVASDDIVATGRGGNLNIETRFLNVSDGGRISTSTFGNGDAGNLTINSLDSIVLSRESSGLFAEADPNAQGQGGVINVQTENLSLNDNAQISAATPLGSGGNINLNLDNTLTLQNNSFISARAFENANGGTLNIDSRFIIAFPGSGNGNDLVSTADTGDGGVINLEVEQVLGLQPGDAIDRNNNFINNETNDIDASSNIDGLGGNININTSSINPTQGTIELPSNIVDLGETIAQVCQSNREAVAKNSLTITGKGGVSAAPGLPLDSHNLVVENEANSNSIAPQPIETSQGKIQPARGIKVTESGEVILTAYKTNNAGDRISEIKRNCNA